MKAHAIQPELKPAIYFGAAISAGLALLPYVNNLFLPVYVLGPLAAVWFAIRIRAQRLTFNDGAQVGFLSAFYGVLAASAAYDIIWQFFHDQLWRLHNAYRLLPLIAGKGQDNPTPFAWYAVMLQLAIGAIIAGAVAAPSGILGVKLFHRDNPP